MRHEFKQDPEGRDRNCQQCGCAYHCGACGEGSGMLGHYVKDDVDHFFYCQDRLRYERDIVRRRVMREVKERAELDRLKAKYE